LPDRDSLVLIRGAGVQDPDNGAFTVRRFRWSPLTDEDGNPLSVRVTLRSAAASSERKRYPNINLDISADQWPNWRPAAVFEKVVEEAVWQG
jgi:hypothetical protein